MRRLSYNIVAVLFSVFCCVPLIKSDNLDAQTKNSNLPAVVRQNGFENLLMEFNNQSTMTSMKESTNESEQSNDFGIEQLTNALLNVYSTSLSKQIPGQSLTKQQMSFPNIQPYLEPVRSYIKTAYRTYLLLNPEMKLAQCLYKYLYMTYPIMRFFRVQNLRLVTRRAYHMMVKFVNSILSGNIFATSETEADKERVALKVAMITKEKPPQKSKTQRSNLAYYGSYSSPQQSTLNHNYNYFNYPAVYQPTTTPNFVYQRVRRQTPQFNSNQPYQSEYPPEKKRTVNEQPQKEIIHQFTDNIQDFEDMDPDAKIDLSNPSLQYEADQLFNLDSLFWKSLGIEDNTLKKYSLAYCGKEYVTSVFQRFIKNVILK